MTENLRKWVYAQICDIMCSPLCLNLEFKRSVCLLF